MSNDEELLFPGAFARVRIEGRIQEDAVLVSERAIGTDLGGKYVLVVTDENIVEHRPVKIPRPRGTWLGRTSRRLRPRS